MRTREDLILSALDQARKEVPIRWYEKIPNLIVLSFITIAVCSPAFHELIKKTYDGIPLSLQIASALTFIVSAVADRQSTIYSFKIADEAFKEGFLISKGEEQNLFLADLRSAEEFEKSLKPKLLDMGVMALATAAPAFGLPASAFKTLAALSNFRQGYRLEHALKIKSTINNTNTY